MHAGRCLRMEGSDVDACSPGRRRPSADRAARGDAAARVPRCAEQGSDLHLLLETVEHAVVPRLRSVPRRDVHRGTQAVARAALEGEFDDRQVDVYLDALMQGEAAAWEVLQQCVARGATVPALCLRLLAPAARALGKRWDDDAFSFADVTIAVGRLLSQLRALSRTLPAEPPLDEDEHFHAMFGAGPGEQHSLGLAMVGDFFRAAGWHVHVAQSDGTRGLLDSLRSHHTDLLGLSVSVERHLTGCAEFIRACRAASGNPGLVVMVGGHLISARPALVEELGADAMACDAREAMLTGLELVARRKEGR